MPIFAERKVLQSFLFAEIVLTSYSHSSIRIAYLLAANEIHLNLSAAVYFHNFCGLHFEDVRSIHWLIIIFMRHNWQKHYERIRTCFIVSHCSIHVNTKVLWKEN